MLQYITINLLSDISGYSPEAIRQKRKNGIWLEGTHWKKAPDGRILFNHLKIVEWIEGKTA